MPMLSIDEVAEFSELARKQLSDLKRENDHMRATLANGPGPCAYCELTREQWSQCKSGFPGCARGDDAVLCPHVGAGMDEDRLRAALIDVAAAHAWLAFGECRAYERYGHTGDPLQPDEADARAREALGSNV